MDAKNKFSELSDKVDEVLAKFKSLETLMQLSATLIFKKKERVCSIPNAFFSV